MNRRATAANAGWLATCLPGAARFAFAVRRTQATQRALLQRILRQNEATHFGQAQDFAHIRSVEQFQDRVPLATYEDFLPHIEAIAAGDANVLVPERPSCLEPSSGSTSASKLIPYTPTLAAQFQAGTDPWVCDMMRRHPRMMQGRAYWSISPAAHKGRVSKGGVPIGFEEDAAYLGSAAKYLLGHVLAVPSHVAQLPDIDSVRYATLKYLLAARDLSFISVWNPTFLELLLQPLEIWADKLVDELGARGREVAKILEAGDQQGRSVYERLWPHLALISCWTSAAASGPAQQLAKLFPNTPIAPKGLLATEGIVTIPMGDRPDGVLSVLSHFFEFFPEDQEGPARTAWQLKEGETYSVVLTTGGGLYRYRLEDLVRVTGFYHQCPRLAFLGKKGRVSDLYGEKLNEAHVAEVLPALGAFQLLAPEGQSRPDHYTLFVAGEHRPADETLRQAAKQLEDGLRRNVHYQYCRELGQLTPAQICWIQNGAPRAFAIYHDHCLQRGQKAGDIKPTALDTETGWRERLVGSRRAREILARP